MNMTLAGLERNVFVQRYNVLVNMNVTLAGLEGIVFVQRYNVLVNMNVTLAGVNESTVHLSAFCALKAKALPT
jgi:hypothetical protein